MAFTEVGLARPPEYLQPRTVNLSITHHRLHVYNTDTKLVPTRTVIIIRLRAPVVRQGQSLGVTKDQSGDFATTTSFDKR